MQEFLYHALGLCGEHWHPNVLNITLIVLLISISSRMIYKKVKQ